MWVWLPPVPVIVMVYVPVFADRETVKLKSVVPDPGAARDEGLKLAVTPEGTPEAEKETAESNPPETVEVTTAYPLWPWSRYPELGETERLKLPVCAPVTVSETVVVSTVLPEVPLTVME